MKFKLLLLAMGFLFLTPKAFANVANEPGLMADCKVEPFSIFSAREAKNLGAIAEAIQEDECGHVPEPLRDNGDPKRSGVGNVLLSCFAGILKGVFQSFWDSIKSFWDIFKVARKLAGIVGEKAVRIAKALWKGGVTAVVNEFVSSSGGGFFAKIKKTFSSLFNTIKGYFVQKIKDVYNCYSPVAQGEVVCNAIAYLGTEFFSGFLFKAVGKVGKLASAAGDFLGLPGLTKKLGAFAKGTIGAHGKLKKFVQVTGPRLVRKVVFKAQGIKKVLVKVNLGYRKGLKKYKTLVAKAKAGRLQKLGRFSDDVIAATKKYEAVNKKLGTLNKKLNGLKKQIESKEMMAKSGKATKGLKEQFADAAIEFEKVTNQARVLGKGLENAITMAESAAHAVSVGVSLKTILDGVSVDGNVLAGSFL